jgi:primosomal protein N'
MTAGREIRCPGCHRLLAVVREDGKIECKISRRVIVTERASLRCLKCGFWVEIGDGGERIATSLRSSQ